MPCAMVVISQVIGVGTIDIVGFATWWAGEIPMEYNFEDSRRGTCCHVPDLVTQLWRELREECEFGQRLTKVLLVLIWVKENIM